MKIKQQKQVKAFLIKEFGKDRGSALFNRQEEMLNILIKNTQNKSQNQMKTLIQVILPGIALFKILSKEEIPEEVSVELSDETDEEVKDFFRGCWNDDTELLKWENPENDYSDWYWENVQDNDLYGEKSETMKQILERLGFVTADNHCPVCGGMLERVDSDNITYRCIRCKNTY